MEKSNLLTLWEFIKTIGPLIIGLLGVIFAYRKNNELKKIRQRANAPFFEFSTFELDSCKRKNTDIYTPWLSYNSTPSQLDGTLISIEEVYPNIPDNYPDNFVIGIELNNRGVEIRSFSVKTKKIHFKHITGNTYSLRYYFRRNEIGKKLFFTIAFETIDGIQEKQKWLHRKGTKEIKRIKPKNITV